jgi:hypothetical protein
MVPWPILFIFIYITPSPLRLYRLRQVTDCCALPVNDLIFFSHSLDHELTHTLTQILTLCVFAWPACLRNEGRIPHANSISTRGMATYIRIEMNGYVQELLIQLPYLCGLELLAVNGNCPHRRYLAQSWGPTPLQQLLDIEAWWPCRDSGSGHEAEG